MLFFIGLSEFFSISRQDSLRKNPDAKFQKPCYLERCSNQEVSIGTPGFVKFSKSRPIFCPPPPKKKKKKNLRRTYSTCKMNGSFHSLPALVCEKFPSPVAWSYSQQSSGNRSTLVWCLSCFMFSMFLTQMLLIWNIYEWLIFYGKYR